MTIFSKKLTRYINLNTFHWLLYSLVFLLIISIILYHTYAGWVLLTYQPKDDHPMPPSQMAADIQLDLTRWHLFETKLKLQTVVPLSRWTLLGIISSPHEPNLAILISDEHNAEQHLYRKGDKLKDESIIENINKDQVILTRSTGESTILTLDWKQKTTPTSKSSEKPVESNTNTNGEEFTLSTGSQPE